MATRSELLEQSVRFEPRAKMRSDLHASMRRRHHAAPSLLLRFRELLNYPVPAYTSIAGFAMALVLMLRPSSPAQQPVVQERVVYVPMGEVQLAEGEREELVRRVTDSVREQLAKQAAAEPVVRPASPAPPAVRAASPTERVTSRERNRLRDSGIEKISPENSITTSAAGNQFVGLANLPQLDIQKRGRSLAEDSSSRQFRWTAGRDSF